MSDFLHTAKVSISSMKDSTFFESIGETVEITDLRMAFRIKKTNKAEPNTCELTISNLSKNSREVLKRKPISVRVEAGYSGVNRLLFVGDVGPGSQSLQDKTEWNTQLLLGDGLRAFSNARVSKSFGPGTPLRTVLRYAATSLGLKLPAEIESLSTVSAGIIAGEVVHGFASDELTRLLAPYGFDWSIQDGKLRIDATERAGGTVRVLGGPDGAAIQGSPKWKVDPKEKEPPVVTVRTTLYPELQVGDLVKIVSADTNGVCRIQQISHVGDTHGQDWYTEVEARHA